MKSFRVWLTATLASAILAPAVGISISPAQTLDSESVLRQQQVQQRVQAMARQLVTAALDVQLQQLRENGLGSHQWYADIRTMRNNLDVLIEAEMPEVIELLGKIETADAAQRSKTFVVARQKSRHIVVRLLVERQGLLRRLRISEMAAQVRRLIKVQTTVMTTTELLPEQPAVRRERLNLSTLEDQRDVKAVYVSFKETLAEVGNWSGPIGVEATEGLRLLETGKVDEELDNSVDHLQSARFNDANVSQRVVIRGLKALLERIERARGLAEADRRAAAGQIRDMIERQQQIREATQQADLSRPQAENLVAQQSEMRQDIADVSQSMQDSPDVQSALESAQEAAYEATASLFEQNQDEALAQQDNVLENLAEAAEEAEQFNVFRPGLTAEEYQQRIDDLQAAREDLRDVEQEQAQASATAEDQPQQAKQHEENVAEQLDRIPENRDLPQPVEAAVQEAQEAATEAAADINADINAQPDQRTESVRAADEAVQRAVSETEVALADARREQLFTRIAELAHAARSLDEAARAEREIAAETARAAEDRGLEAEQASELADTQEDVQTIANKVAEGIESTAPKAAETLQQAEKPIAETGNQLQSAQQDPGEESKTAARTASQQAEQAAELMEQAAGEIREQLQQAAQQMAQLGTEQFEQVQTVQENVEQNMADELDSIAQRGQQADQLARQSVPVDPWATSALRDAQHQAEQAAAQGTQPQPQADVAEQGVQQSMGEAAASLGERADQIAQDTANALALAAAGMQPASPQSAGGEPSQPGESSGEGRQSGQPMPAQLMPDGMPMPIPGATPGGRPLANVPIREASQLASAMSGMPIPSGMPMPGGMLLPGRMPLPGNMPLPGGPQMPGISMPGPPSPQIGTGGVSLAGPQVQNAPPMEMGIQGEPEEVPNGQATPDSPEDAEPGERSFIEDSWFAKLPPELRKAIRNNSRRRPPRGYEERLMRYFESID